MPQNSNTLLNTLLKSTLTFSAPSKIKVNWTSWCRGGGIFCDQIFFSQKVKVSPGTHLNTRKYSFCGIKLETKVINLHKIEVVHRVPTNYRK